MPSCGLEPRQETVSVSEIPCYSLRCLLLSAAMQSNTEMAKQTRGCPYLALWLVGYHCSIHCSASKPRISGIGSPCSNPQINGLERMWKEVVKVEFGTVSQYCW